MQSLPTNPSLLISMWLSWGLLFFLLVMMYTFIYFKLMRFEVCGDAVVFGYLNANRISARFED